MTRPPQVIIYGEKCFRLSPYRRSTRASGLDVVYGHWQSDRPDSFSKDKAPPDFPNMRVKSCDTIDEIEGLAYEHRWEAEGLLDGADRIEINRLRQPEEGWDEGTLTMLTVRPELYVQAASHPIFTSLVVLDLDKEDINGHVWRVQLTCKGIYLPKAKKRRYTSNGKEITAQTAFIIAGIAGSEAQKWTTPLQRLQMTERYLVNGPIPSDLIGQTLVGSDVPADTPTINASSVDTLSTTGRRFNFPFGWTVTGVTGERLLDGRPEHDVTVQYTYLPVSEPGGTA